MVAHEEVQAGGVAAAHLEPVDGRQRDLHRVERFERRDRRLGGRERGDLARGAQTVAPDGPHRVARPDEGGVDRLERRHREACRPGRRRARARARRTGRSAAGSGPRSGAPACGSPRMARTPGTPRSAASTTSTASATACRRPRRPPSRWSAVTVGAARELEQRAVEFLDQLGGVGHGRVARRRTTPTIPHIGRNSTDRRVPLGPPRARTRSTRRSAAPSAASGSVASTMTRTSGSVPDGRTSTRPSSPSSSSTSRTRLQKAASRARASAPSTATLRSTCGTRVTTDASSESDRPRRAMVSSRKMPVRVPSPVVAWSA